MPNKVVANSVDEAREALESPDNTPIQINLSQDSLAPTGTEEKGAGPEDMLKESTTTPVVPDDQRYTDEEIAEIQKEAVFGSTSPTGADLPTIVVSSEEKASFIDAVVYNTRFTRPFEAFSGRIHGIFRCRTIREQQAISAHLQACVRDRKIVTEAEFLSELRACSLSAQVARLNELEFDLLPEPLFASADKDGSVVPHGWTDRVSYWKKQEENNLPLVLKLFKLLRDFEILYWTLVKDSEDANF